MRAAIGESLCQTGIITQEDLRAALREHERTGERLAAVLVRMKLATERQIAEALASQFGLTYIDLAARPPDPAAVILIPRDIASSHHCVAVAVDGNTLTVAMSDPLLFTLVQDLEFQTGYRIRQAVATRAEIAEAIQTWYPGSALARQTAGALQTRGSRPASESPRGPLAPSDMAPEAGPIVDMVDLIIRDALRNGASDIHIEPGDGAVAVRHRLDGILKATMDLPAWIHDGLVARVKIMAGLDIAEKRLPQDGRIRAPGESGKEVDLRVSTLRTIFGEKIVLRVLDHRRGVPPLEDLGLSAAPLEQTRGLLRHQHGMILVVGPTGSGKTTTLASALASIRSGRTNIVTVEDPVEYQLPGINQTQVHPKIGLTFASALRSILRQDPDVVLIGEIRDQEAARIAMQAAQTGHLVLSTLHTDDAPSCVTRLADMGIEPYVSASALIGVIAQRLVRRLCIDCRRSYVPPADTLRALSVSESEAPTLTFYRAEGCERCGHTGYRGRVGIYEIMPITDDLRLLIGQRGAEAQLREAALTAGMTSLAQDGLHKVKAGITSPQELLRVVTEVRDARAACPECGTGVARCFAACPGCGRRIGGACEHCGRSTRREWSFCPYCAKRITAAPERRSAGPDRERGLTGAGADDGFAGFGT